MKRTLFHYIVGTMSVKTLLNRLAGKLFFLLLLSSCFSTGVFAQSNAGSVQYTPTVCCNRYPYPCNKPADIIIGTSYIYQVVFEVNSLTNTNDVNTLVISMEDPGANQLTVSNLSFTYTATGNPVTLPFTMTPYSSVEIQAYFEVVLAPTSIITGDYEVTARIAGTQYVPKAVPFSDESYLYHLVSDSECFEPVELTETGNSEREGLNENRSILPPQWYPNPTQNSAILELDVKEDTYVNVEIMDMQGRTLMRPLSDQNLKSGMNRRKVDVSQLAAGIYYTRITTGTETQVIKWVKIQ